MYNEPEKVKLDENEQIEIFKLHNRYICIQLNDTQIEIPNFSRMLRLYLRLLYSHTQQGTIYTENVKSSCNNMILL